MKFTVNQRSFLTLLKDNWFLWNNSKGQIFLCPPDSEIFSESSETGYPEGNDAVKECKPFTYRTIKSLIDKEFISQDEEKGVWVVTPKGYEALGEPVVEKPENIPGISAHINCKDVLPDVLGLDVTMSVFDNLMIPDRLMSAMQEWSMIDNNDWNRLSSMASGLAHGTGKPEDARLIMSFACLYMMRWYAARFGQINNAPVEVSISSIFSRVLLDGLDEGYQDYLVRQIRIKEQQEQQQSEAQSHILVPRPEVVKPETKDNNKSKLGAVGKKELERLNRLFEGELDVNL
jgi:hypothetical protein